LFVISVVWLLILILASVLGPKCVTSFSPDSPDYDAVYQPPSRKHPAGTDSLGRDMLSRLIAGGRISLRIAAMASLLNLLLGVSWGALSGYAGGRIDQVMMRIVDVLYGLPTILVVILLMVYLDQGIRNIYLAIGLTYWLNMARIVRGETLAIKQMEYIVAARSLGASSPRIILSHIIPNASASIFVTVMFFIPEAIFAEAFLSYIGLGVPAPGASWGTLASEGTRNLQSYPYLMWYPAAVICITMLAFNIVGDDLRRRWNKQLTET